MAHGSHPHAALYRDAMVTSADGAHTHTFTLPDGSKLETSGGAHAHVLSTERANWTDGGGSHSHKVEIDDDVAYTDLDGWHSHELGEDSVTESGLHSHYLYHPSGAVIMSDMPGDVAAKAAHGKKTKVRRIRPKRDEGSVESAVLTALDTLRAMVTEKESPKPTAKAGESEDDWSWADADDLSPPSPTTPEQIAKLRNRGTSQ